ncbi:5146_t:CDS:1 [Paraglomus occultum]|uniref:DNA-directed DNA polymerase n=1 Tax=Paraglomus occultum TaxID=144539 RepID=A0A9N8Z2Y4_9GLOM|nr:5146_t:CDS:1 [Paraglomus occultum]
MPNVLYRIEKNSIVSRLYRTVLQQPRILLSRRTFANIVENKNDDAASVKEITNGFDVVMLPDWLYKQVFPGQTKRPTVPPARERVAKQHLEKQGLLGKATEPVPHLTEFQLPKLCGNTIAEHFWKIGEEQARPIREIALNFSKIDLPQRPQEHEWLFRANWTRYVSGKKPKSVKFPDEELLCFDTEVAIKDDAHHPLLAVAASPTAWYCWISPRLIEHRKMLKLEKTKRKKIKNEATEPPKKRKKALGYLIPMGKRDKYRLIVGHNVGYDRARIKEEYNANITCNRFLDTMALHIAVSGLCTQQRPSWIKFDKATEEEDNDYLLEAKDFKKVYDVSSMNSLANVAKFHSQVQLDKSQRDYFVTGSLDEIADPEVLPQLISYCASDVEATHVVYRKVFPRFLELCPHPVSFAGIIHMGNMFLTTSSDWDRYIKAAESVYLEQSSFIKKSLIKLANQALRKWKKDPKSIQKNHWLKQLDWSPPSPKARKLVNYPKWYRDCHCNKTNELNLSARSRFAPILLELSWMGYPMYHSKIYGWMFRVPSEDTGFSTKAKKLVFKTSPDDEDYEERYATDTEGHYYKIPHKDGDNARCGSPLAKHYISAFENKILSSGYPEAREALSMNAACSYWISARERIKSQMVIYGNREDIEDLGFKMAKCKTPGMILPQTLTMGTITRRAVEKTWLTASNVKKNRIGSELKAMIQAPVGYKFVGADVDSEELWIASLIGDSSFKSHGATAMGWMTLQGTKAAGTDMHSRTAKILGISRDHAKIFNYGRIYGAGLKFAIQLLRQFNENIAEEEAQQRVEELYRQTKGSRFFTKGNHTSFWYGGSESFMFNNLEDIATDENPKTPVLKCCITDALKSQVVKNEYMTSRINWAVQSSGVDYLHLLLVSMEYLIKKYDINARFMLSVHDEIRYLVNDKDVFRTTLALQISNLWTRVMFSHMLGIQDLPLSVAFFSSIDIDHVLRKEVDMDCKTVSFPKAIEQGVSVTIQKILETVNTLGGENSQDEILPKLDEKSTKFIEPLQLKKDDLTSLRMQAATTEDEVRTELLGSSKSMHSRGRPKKSHPNSERVNMCFLN